MARVFFLSNPSVHEIQHCLCLRLKRAYPACYREGNVNTVGEKTSKTPKTQEWKAFFSTRMCLLMRLTTTTATFLIYSSAQKSMEKNEKKDIYRSLFWEEDPKVWYAASKLAPRGKEENLLFHARLPAFEKGKKSGSIKDGQVQLLL